MVSNGTAVFCPQIMGPGAERCHESTISARYLLNSGYCVITQLAIRVAHNETNNYELRMIIASNF